MNSPTAKNLEAIVKAVRQHDSNCTEKAKAVAMCAFEVDRLDFDSIPVDGRDIPIIVGESIGSGRFRVICDGYHGPQREEEIQDTVEAPAPAERELVPIGAPEEGLPEHEEGRLWTPGEATEDQCDPEADFWAFADRVAKNTGMKPSFLTPLEEMQFYTRIRHQQEALTSFRGELASQPEIIDNTGSPGSQ